MEEYQLTGSRHYINNIRTFKAGTLLWAMFLKYVNGNCKNFNNKHQWFVCNITSETAKGYHQRMRMKTYAQLNDEEKKVAVKYGYDEVLEDEEYMFYFQEHGVDYSDVFSIISQINNSKKVG